MAAWGLALNMPPTTELPAPKLHLLPQRAETGQANRQRVGIKSPQADALIANLSGHMVARHLVNTTA
jgi:hypothetical protein